MKRKLGKIIAIYDAFETKTAPFKEGAACEMGCAYCCKEAGSIDITTMEGLIIKERIDRMPRARQASIKKAIARDMKYRQAGKTAVCPFLMKNNGCMIYAVRPFACRRIYSVHRCDAGNPPALNRNVMDIAAETIRSLQQLDDTGYSGHISCILHMLAASRFLSTYLSGEFKPEEIVDFGKMYKIVINRMVSS